MQHLVTAGAGFLLAVLWFDLMFDVQAIGKRTEALPEAALPSIAGYYRRVTTEARPMNRLVAVAMLATIAAAITEVVRGDESRWVAWASLVLVVAPVMLAVTRTFGAARRLGSGVDAVDVQRRLARSIARDHVACLVAIASVLAIRIGFA